MKKADLINFLVADYGYRIEPAKIIVEAIFRKISYALIAGESVQIADFGTLGIKKRAARKGRNPRTGEPLQLPETNRVFFKAGKALREAINR